jgi:hypothetical protein
MGTRVPQANGQPLYLIGKVNLQHAESSIARIVAVCTRYPWWVIAFALVLGILTSADSERWRIG